ncbi:MAG: TetR family transcriptional regulator [Chloroflexota bacterium]|nr:TetR family transcriptional regulator [Chloroflexota bacterium]
MADVKTRRQVAAEQTQRAIIEAAARLFAQNGYQQTSIAQIAAAAGVAVQTVYNSIGGKRELLSRVLDFAAAGDRAPEPVPEFMRRMAEAETDPRRIIDQLVRFWQDALARTAPVFRILREAAVVDADAAALERRRAAQRLRNYGQAAELLAARGALRSGLTLDAAAATIFAIGHPETYRALVIEGGWDAQRWAAWARASLHNALLTPSRT